MDPRGSHFSDSSDAAVERALLVRIARDDHAALTELFDRTACRIYAILLRWVPSPQEADTILRQVFMQLWETRHSVRASMDRPVLGLIESARRLAIEERSSAAGVRDDSAGFAWPIGPRSAEAQPPGPAPSPKELLRAIYVQGATLADLASRHGLSPVSLRETLVAAMKELRRELKVAK